MAQVRDVVFDCSHPASLARFWAAALDEHRVAPYDAAELDRLHAQGIDDPEDDPSVLVERPGHLPRLWFQRVPEPKRVKNRLHLDLACDHDDVASEVDRLVGLGAAVEPVQPNDTLIVMRDPEGNEFCLLR
jgi:hypothetical protein